MGPSDPFATTSAPPAEPAPPPISAPADPFRVQTRESPLVPARPLSRKVLVGAAIGAFIGLLAVTLSAGELFFVLACGLLGAALAVVLQSAFPDGVDVQAAWRALRR